MYIKGCFRVSVCYIRTFERCTGIQSSRKYHDDRRDLERKWKHRLEIRTSSRFDNSKQKLQNRIPVSSFATFYVLSTGSQGVGRSLLLTTGLDRYLFNCGEGTQKILIDTVFRPGVVYNTFITYNSWDNIGGLMGFMINNTVHTPSQPFFIHGPKNVDAGLQMTGMFSESNTLARANIEHCGIEHKQYEDQQLTVEYVELLSNEPVQMSQPSSPVGSGHVELITKTMSINNTNEKTVMAYVIKLKDLPPKIDPDKIRSLGIPPGEWVKRLHHMETVTLDDGRVVKPEDVSINQEAVGPVIILDCPSLDYLDSLILNEQFLNIETKYDMPPHMIVHMAPCEVVNHHAYKEFMNRFQSSTLHLMLNENSTGHYSEIRQEQQTVLHHIHPQLFPELYQVYDRKPESQSGNVIQGMYGLQYNLRSPQGFQWDKLLYVDKSAVYDTVKEKALEDSMKLMSSLYDEEEIEQWGNFNMLTIDKEFTNLKLKLAELESDTDVSEEYPELTFLGTGSAMPSGTRNASCILVQMRKDEYLFLDCGEGTLLQMLQMFGLEKTEHILSNTKAVFLSHLHYDHHGGVFAIAEARERVLRGEGRQDKLVVLAPPTFKKWENLYSRHILCRSAPLKLIPVVAENISEIVLQNLDVVECSVPKVRHTTASYGLSISHRDGWKLVYSGDCMPSKSLIKDGMDCDILIHEGTFDDTQLKHAQSKKHCTTSQALDVAKEMRAKFTILTHFSQNSPTIPLFTDKFTDNVGFAFDFMQVRPSQYKQIPLLKPLLDCLYGASHRRRILRRNDPYDPKHLETLVDDEGTLDTRKPSKDSKKHYKMKQNSWKNEQTKTSRGKS